MVNGYGYHLPDRITKPAKMVQTPTAGVLFLWVCRDCLLYTSVCDHIRTVHLHQIRFAPESGFTGTGAADHQHIFVAGGLWVLGAAVHGQAFGVCENDIVLEHRVDVGSNILTGSP